MSYNPLPMASNYNQPMIANPQSALAFGGVGAQLPAVTLGGMSAKMGMPANGTGWSPGTSGSGWAGTGLGVNMGTAQLALGGLGALGNMWTGMQANRLARQQFNFTRDVTNTNLANQIKAYNTTLSDRARSRGFTESAPREQTERYIRENSVSR